MLLQGCKRPGLSDNEMRPSWRDLKATRARGARLTSIQPPSMTGAFNICAALYESGSISYSFVHAKCLILFAAVYCNRVPYNVIISIPTIVRLYWHHHPYTPHIFQIKSKLSTSNKLLIYKTILKSIWTYWIQLWGTASTSNIEILERFQWKTLRMTVDAPWYVPNTVIRRDLQMPTVKEEIRRYSSQYSARLSAHPNVPNSKPHWVTRQQAIEETPAKWSAYQIPSVILVSVVLVFKV
jgi:hypothetical protein